MVSPSQYKRAKPTHTDPEDDRYVDPTLPSGSTSKTCNPRADSQFWQKKSTDGDPGSSSSSVSSTQWQPRLRAEKDLSTVAGDTSDSSTAIPRLGSIEELAEALRDLRVQATQALDRLGSS